MRISTSFHVPAGPDEVYAHLMVPSNYVGLAPLVVAVRDIRPSPDGASYVAVERFRFGPFHWDNPIRVTMTGSGGDQITSAVISPGGVRLNAVLRLESEAGGTRATEDVEVTCAWFLRRFVRAKAAEAAAGRAKELTRRFS